MTKDDEPTLQAQFDAVQAEADARTTPIRIFEHPHVLLGNCPGCLVLGIEAKVREIEHVGRTDDENAHILEDNLYQEVLQAIAAGAKNASELAAAALKTLDLEHDRWCG